MNRAEIFQQVFGIYAEEFWAKPEQEMLEWIAGENEFKNSKGDFKAANPHCCSIDYENKAKAIRKTYSYMLTPPKDTTNIIDTRTVWWDECSNCEQKLSPTWKYCPYCGSKLEWN